MEEWQKELNGRSSRMSLLAILFVLTASDIILTAFALDNGFVEANPIMAALMDVSMPFAISVKYAIVFVPVAISMIFSMKHLDKYAKISLIVSVLINAFVVVWNVIMISLWLP